MLQLRINDFEKALKENQDPFEREQVIQQYNRFAKTLHLCLSRPGFTTFYAMNYFKFRYHPVGINDAITPEPIRHNISLAATILGATLILASFAAFAFNPLIGAILLPIGITLLAPGCISLFIPDPPDTSTKKLEENIIFQTGAKLIEPSLTFDETHKNEGHMYVSVM